MFAESKKQLYTLEQVDIILGIIKKLTQQTVFIHNTWYNKVYSCIIRNRFPVSDGDTERAHPDHPVGKIDVVEQAKV